MQSVQKLWIIWQNYREQDSSHETFNLTPGPNWEIWHVLCGADKAFVFLSTYAQTTFLLHYCNIKHRNDWCRTAQHLKVRDLQACREWKWTSFISRDYLIHETELEAKVMQRGFPRLYSCLLTDLCPAHTVPSGLMSNRWSEIWAAPHGRRCPVEMASSQVLIYCLKRKTNTVFRKRNSTCKKSVNLYRLNFI